MFDWARAIERNRDALTGIIAALFAMLGLHQAGGTVGRIPRELHRSVLRVLRPAESAVRRLVVIAARGLVLKPVPARPKPQGRIVGKGGGTPRSSFQLFDPRKRFFRRPATRYRKNPPRIWVPDDTPPNVRVFRPEDFGRPAPAPPDNTVDGQRLCRRLEALRLALADLPRQAKRLVRLKARREALQKRRPTFTSPLRPGRPPGYRKKPRHEVDHVLIECHGLARDVERLDTS
jgi:hypothetical protein